MREPLYITLRNVRLTWTNETHHNTYGKFVDSDFELLKAVEEVRVMLRILEAICEARDSRRGSEGSVFRSGNRDIPAL